MILGALPAGALVYVIAQHYDIYVQRASASIVLTTAISIASVSGLLILFGIAEPAATSSSMTSSAAANGLDASIADHSLDDAFLHIAESTVELLTVV